MREKFTTSAQVADYLAGDTIECLECGKQFQFLGRHLPRMHGIDCDEYRELWGLPAMTPLAGQAYRQAHRDKIHRLQASGALTYDHLLDATKKAAGKGGGKIGIAKIEHAALIAQLRPGDAHLLPPGAKRADGRDADRAREYQQRQRAELKRRKEKNV